MTTNKKITFFTMKTRLPLSLRAALVAALSATVVSADNSSTMISDIQKIVYVGENEVENLQQYGSTSEYFPVAKDGAGILSFTGTGDATFRLYGPGEKILDTIENCYEYKDALFVREGELKIGDGSTKTSFYFNANPTGRQDFKNASLSIAGKDAKVTISGAEVAFNYNSPYSLGGMDGNGKLVITEGSKVLCMSYRLSIGDMSVEEATYPDGHIDPYNAASMQEAGAVPSVDGRYTGIYSEAVNGSGAVFGRGDIEVKGASTFHASNETIMMSEGSILVDGKGSKMTATINRFWFSHSDNGTAVIMVRNEGEVDLKLNSLRGAYGHDSSALVYVEGNGSVFTLRPNSTNGQDEAILGFGGNNSSCDFYANDGGTLNLLNSITKVCGVEKRNASVSVGVDSYLNAKHLVVGVKGSLVNRGDAKLDKLEVDNGVVDNYGDITTESLSLLNEGVLNNAGTLNVKEQLEIAKTATLNCLAGSTISGVMPTGCTYAFTLSARNLSVAGTTLAAGTEYSTATPLTLKLEASENLLAGKYMLLDATQGVQTNRAATPAEIESVTGLGAKKEDIVWEDGILYFYLGEQLLVARDPLADAVQAANWGVYKSSQAFSSLLWAPRSNAVVVKNIQKPTADGKGSIMTTEVEGRTLAWGSVYSSFSRNSSSGAFAGAEYSIFGGAIGVERQFACGSSIGAAFGYDWGKASPFSTSRVDQESWHAALYGRAAEWKLGQKSSVALDWSAAVGSTTSEHKALGSDWTQENIQLDARATYTYALTERTALSAFVGAQYYAQNDDSTEKVQADSLQNLRLMVGGGISHKLTEKTTLFGEAMLFNDTMRHNPDVTLDGFEYGTGANPGRLGGSVTAGAQYQLTPDWTLRGSYSYEGADNSNEHRVNVGAVYSF